MFFQEQKAHHVSVTLSKTLPHANTTLIKPERAGGFHISQWIWYQPGHVAIQSLCYEDVAGQHIIN